MLYLLAEHLGFPPRQVADALHRVGAEFLQGGVVLARQVRERERAELLHPEIDEVIRIVLPAHEAPRVGIDRAYDQLGAIVLEERLELGGQQIDRAAHDVAMRVGAPRERGSGRERSGHDQRSNDGRLSHSVILAAGGTTPSAFERRSIPSPPHRAEQRAAGAPSLAALRHRLLAVG